MIAPVLLIGSLVFIYYFYADPYRGLVGDARFIADGDSFQLCDGDECTRIRLCGIDAPELDDAGGKEARQALKRLVSGETIECIPMGEGTICDGLGKHRSYGRTVAQCFVGNRDLAEEQVRAGHACDLPRFSDGHYGAIKGSCSN